MWDSCCDITSVRPAGWSDLNPHLRLSEGGEQLWPPGVTVLWFGSSLMICGKLVRTNKQLIGPFKVSVMWILQPSCWIQNAFETPFDDVIVKILKQKAEKQQRVERLRAESEITSSRKPASTPWPSFMNTPRHASSNAPSPMSHSVCEYRCCQWTHRHYQRSADKVYRI